MRSLIFVAVLTWSVSAFAQQVGDTVVVITQEAAKLEVGKEVVQTVPRCVHLTVENTDDNGYFVTWKHKSGWIIKRDVLPPDAALQYFTDAITKSPKDAYTYASRGYMYGRQAKYDKAIEDCTEAIQLDPK